MPALIIYVLGGAIAAAAVTFPPRIRDDEEVTRCMTVMGFGFVVQMVVALLFAMSPPY